jgi:hypothetical protein
MLPGIGGAPFAPDHPRGCFGGVTMDFETIGSSQIHETSRGATA